MTKTCHNNNWQPDSNWHRQITPNHYDKQKTQYKQVIIHIIIIIMIVSVIIISATIIIIIIIINIWPEIKDMLPRRDKLGQLFSPS